MRCDYTFYGIFVEKVDWTISLRKLPTLSLLQMDGIFLFSPDKHVLVVVFWQGNKISLRVAKGSSFINKMLCLLN